MLEARLPSAEIGEVLTRDEIYARYPEQWILVVETHGPPNDYRFRTARVVAHGPHRKEVLTQASHFLVRYGGVGSFYTGPVRAPVRTFVDVLPP